MSLPSPFALALLHHRRPEPAGSPDRPGDGRRIGAVPRHRRPRRGHRGRADPQRHDDQLSAARHPAVHPRGRVHERRQHHGQARAVLQRAGRPLPRRTGSGQRRAGHRLLQHVGVCAGRCRRRGQAHAGADDARRKIPAGLRRGADVRRGHDRTDHPAVDPAGRLFAGLGCLGGLPVPRRRDPRAADRRRADGA